MLSVRTPAKINLFLNIRPPRADGFHEICSVMQAIQLWDRLTVTPALERSGMTFSSNIASFASDPESNLVVRAYHHFWKTTGLPPLNLNVHLDKYIPWQAGLGGGSSDAAAMLAVLNHLSHANLSMADMMAMAAELGSDVPFFLVGGTALATGRGELIEPVSLGRPLALPLVVIQARRMRVDTGQA